MRTFAQGQEPSRVRASSGSARLASERPWSEDRAGAFDVEAVGATRFHHGHDFARVSVEAPGVSRARPLGSVAGAPAQRHAGYGHQLRTQIRRGDDAGPGSPGQTPASPAPEARPTDTSAGAGRGPKLYGMLSLSMRGPLGFSAWTFESEP